MALETKLEFIGVDKTGRIITVKDITGLYNATTNPTGYGSPNLEISDIESILFTISEFDSPTVYKLRFVRVSDVNHPEYLLIPSIDDIANGVTNVEFTSIVLGITTPQAGLRAFTDGVYDINMYTLTELTSAALTSGSKLVIGSGLDIIYNQVDYIVSNNDIYTIDKSVPSDPNILTLTEEVKEDSNEFYLAYRTNIKGLNQATSDCCGQAEAGKVALDDCCDCKQKKLDNLFKLWMYKIAAQLDFNCGNYIQANDLLKGAQKVCKSLNCKC